MTSSLRSGLSVSICTLICLCGASIGQADTVAPSIVIEAANASGGGQYVFTPDDASYYSDTRVWEWELTEPLQIRDPMTQSLVATVESASYLLVDSAQVNLSFSVAAGSTDTLFQITSALMPVDPPISPAQGAASAAFTVTDFDGDGATLTGSAGAGGDKAYLAHYNGFVPAGTAFAELISDVTATAWATGDSFENFPAVGYAPIADPVTDISAMVSFELSANDLASGTTDFVIVPEASSLALLALGAIGLLRRR